MSSLSSPAAAATEAASGQSISSAEHVLVSIHDLLERKLQSDDRLRRRADCDQRLASEWTIAAGVVDRICFVILSAAFVAGIVLFLALFLARSL